ncbi:MAG TPA: hypothetical protein VGB03_06905, partial [Acidimicrobiales bacterium]
MKRSSFIAVVVVALVGSTVGSGARAAVGAEPAAPSAAKGYAAGRYIVTFADDPVASYDGYQRGYPATRPAPGRKLDADSPAARQWQQHLVAK